MVIISILPNIFLQWNLLNEFSCRYNYFSIRISILSEDQRMLDNSIVSFLSGKHHGERQKRLDCCSFF